jgi:hypothetical protein
LLFFDDFFYGINVLNVKITNVMALHVFELE